MNKELLPCPFCGDSDFIIAGGYEDFCRWELRCKGCRNRFKGGYDGFKTKDEMITAWNARATPPNKPFNLTESIIDFIVENEGTIQCAYASKDRTILDNLMLVYNKPLTLEQLKERVGKPVFICDIQTKKGEWVVISKVNINKEFCIIKYTNGEYSDLSVYAKTWLAYDHEPKGE